LRDGHALRLHFGRRNLTLGTLLLNRRTSLTSVVLGATIRRNSQCRKHIASSPNLGLSCDSQSNYPL
jgi:hypothetical protein